MNSFTPGILILTGGYHQNSSGGQITGGSGSSDDIYTDGTYYYFFDDGDEGEGWYKSEDPGCLSGVWVGTDKDPGWTVYPG